MLEREKSNTPMILGIVGFVAMIPGLLCASACGAFVEGMSATSGESSGFGGFVFSMTAIPMIAGFIFSFLSKSKAMLSGIVMTASAVILLIPVILSGNWFFGLITVACYLVGGILAFQNK